MRSRFGPNGAAGVAIAVSVAVLLLALCPAPSSAGFVTVSGDKFMLDGSDYTFAGFSLWQVTPHPVSGTTQTK